MRWSFIARNIYVLIASLKYFVDLLSEEKILVVFEMGGAAPKPGGVLI